MDFKSPSIYALLSESGAEEHHTSCIASTAGCPLFEPQDREPLMSKSVLRTPTLAAYRKQTWQWADRKVTITKPCCFIVKTKKQTNKRYLALSVFKLNQLNYIGKAFCIVYTFMICTVFHTFVTMCGYRGTVKKEKGGVSTQPQETTEQ